MKWKIRVKKWLGVLLFAVLSVVVFYTSYVVEQKSLTVSLFGLFFVLLMGLLAFKLDHWIVQKNYRLLRHTLIVLVLANAMFFILEIVVFSGGLYDFLIFSIIYTVVYSGLMYIKYKRGLEKNVI
ncbi:hypothetical protein GCM10009001_29480 [Virgibacillus siamensis]|uniref:Permease n=1 Tax=Virgibacillus siamensis TaxID=480071 RepID=A0ABN1GF62_9BACI